MTMSPVDLYSE